jgi:hypothetical protein
MKKKTFVLLCLFVGMATTSAFSQEWTKAQLEVWQVIENEWNAYKAGDVTALAAVIHPKYQGWDGESPLPYTKVKTVQQVGDILLVRKLNFMDIEPARITVTDNAAVVDYYYNFTFINAGDETKKVVERKGRAVEFYVKEKGSWLLLGDMGVEQK